MSKGPFDFAKSIPHQRQVLGALQQGQGSMDVTPRSSKQGNMSTKVLSDKLSSVLTPIKKIYKSSLRSLQEQTSTIGSRNQLLQHSKV